MYLSFVLLHVGAVLTCMASQDFLLVSHNYQDVYYVDVSSGAKTRLALPRSSHPFGLTYDHDTARVIWSNLYAKSIVSAYVDGSDFKVEINATARGAGSMLYHTAISTLYYNEWGTINRQKLDGSLSSTVSSEALPQSQIAIHPNTGRIYAIGRDGRHVWSVAEDGSGKTTAFSVPSGINLWGLTFHPQGHTVYGCGTKYLSGQYTSFYYKFDVASRIMSPLGSQQGVLCYRLATDGRVLFIFNIEKNELLEAPLGSPLAATALGGVWHGRIHDMEYVNAPAECIKGPKQRQRIRIADNSKGGEEVTSFPISVRTQCRLTGDKDAMATFDVASSTGTCRVLLKPGKQLDISKKRMYNISLTWSGSCPWMTAAEANLTVEVYPGKGCHPLPESSAPGDVALEIPIGYHSQAKPVSIALREHTQGEERQFAIQSPLLSGDSNVTGMAKVVLAKKIDLENSTSRLHLFTVELEYCVEITDVNDNKPVFAFPDVTKGSLVPWKEETTGVIATVHATDSDEGKFGTDGIRYFIVADPTSGSLSLDAQTGEVQAVTKIDRETSPEQLHLVIEARDNEGIPPYNKAVSVLAIKIQDINDNAPQFTKTTYTLPGLLDVIPDGYVVLEVEAMDADEGANAQIDYSFNGTTTSAPFMMNSNTGQIKVSGSLRGKAGTYSLVVRATDRGTPPLSSTATVVIEVQSITSFPGRRRREAQGP